MELTDFTYDLPQELIAQTPIEPRDHSRLLVFDRKNGDLEHKYFYDIADELVAGDVLVFNDTKVIPARLHGHRRGSGGKVEVLLLTPAGSDEWEVLVKPGKKAQIGECIDFSDTLSCEVLGKTDFGGRVVKFTYQGVFDEIIEKIGEMPLPPYIHEKLIQQDRYQTVYAKVKGSAAAPTAGLHFTPELLEKLQARGVETVAITLHVGLGTFRPVSEEKIEDHHMHSEFYIVPPAAAQAVNRAKDEGRRIIAVGTTSVRTMESMGQTGRLQSGSGWTNIFIYPGFTFNIIDGLITNFHLPQSTLLMLVSAFSDREKMLAAYATAVKEKYRFFSFGDAMFIR